ncbi:MAG: hypothetical protein WED07_05560 [Candidatus Freyarchaeum deiterrae]
MSEDNSHFTIFNSVSGDSGSGTNYGSSSSSGKNDVMRRLMGGDLCKRAIFDVLSSGGWFTVLDLCRAARNCDRGVGIVRVSTILNQFQQSLGSDFLESRMGRDATEWRINPEFLRSAAGVLSELKSRDNGIETKITEGGKSENVKTHSSLLRNLLGKTSDLNL